MSGLALLYAGWPYDPTGNTIIDVAFPSYKPIDFCRGKSGCGMRYFVNHGMEGFSTRYHHEGIENTHHWAGHLLVGYHEGWVKNSALVRLREALQADKDRSADIAMGDVAGYHGSNLRRGWWTIVDFAAHLVEVLAEK